MQGIGPSPVMVMPDSSTRGLRVESSYGTDRTSKPKNETVKRVECIIKIEIINIQKSQNESPEKIQETEGPWRAEQNPLGL